MQHSIFQPLPSQDHHLSDVRETSHCILQKSDGSLQILKHCNFLLTSVLAPQHQILKNLAFLMTVAENLKGREFLTDLLSKESDFLVYTS